jgi:predicted secreted protein
MLSALFTRGRAASVALLVVSVAALGACGSDKSNDVATESTTSSSAAASSSTTAAAASTSSTAAAPATTAKPGATTTTRGAATTHKYTKADNGKTVAVKPGDKVEVTLDECAGSCGYEWRQTTAPDPKVLKATGESKTDAQNAPGMVGGSGTHTFKYEAVGVGTTSFKLGYFGPAQTAPDESFTLTVKVG